MGSPDFRFNTTGSAGSEEPEGNVKEVRVDIPPGLSVNPFATPQCTLEQLEKTACPPESQVGEVKLTAHLNLVELLGHPVGATITPPNTAVYNMVPPPGHPLEAAFKVALFETVVHIVGGIETSGPHPDYHEYFTIKDIPTTPELVESRLIFFGTKIDGGKVPFITMPSTCSGPQTTYLHVVSYGGQEETKAFTTPVGANGCDKIPFKPTVKVEPVTSQYDHSDGATVKVEVPQNADPASIDSSTLKDAYVSLPEGMTLNPAAASGLQACSDDQFGKVTSTTDLCPARLANRHRHDRNTGLAARIARRQRLCRPTAQQRSTVRPGVPDLHRRRGAQLRSFASPRRARQRRPHHGPSHDRGSRKPAGPLQ